MDMLFGLMMAITAQVYVYNNTTLYTLNIYNFLLVNYNLNKSGRKKTFKLVGLQ